MLTSAYRDGLFEFRGRRRGTYPEAKANLAGVFSPATARLFRYQLDPLAENETPESPIEQLKAAEASNDSMAKAAAIDAYLKWLKSPEAASSLSSIDAESLTTLLRVMAQ